MAQRLIPDKVVDRKRFGLNLWKLIDAKYPTIQAFAWAMVYTAPSTVQNWLNGHAMPNSAQLKLIVKTLGTDYNTLMEGV